MKQWDFGQSWNLEQGTLTPRAAVNNLTQAVEMLKSFSLAVSLRHDMRQSTSLYFWFDC